MIKGKKLILAVLTSGLLFLLGLAFAHPVNAAAKIGYIQKNAQLYTQPQNRISKYTVTQYNVPIKVYNKKVGNKTKVMYKKKVYYVPSKEVSLKAKTYYNSFNVSHYTRYDLSQALQHLDDSNVQLPTFKADDISDLNSARDEFHPGLKGQKLDVGDHWVLKNPDGSIANYHGYYLMFAMTFNANADPRGLNGKVYLFYQKANEYDRGVDSWKSAGPVFLSNKEGVDTPNALLSEETGEWSGSAVTQSDGSIRLFYTSFSDRDVYQQTLATADLKLDTDDYSVSIDHDSTNDRKIIFEGDGKYYETMKQMEAEKNRPSNDDHTLRDANYVESNGHKYLVFEGNTGLASGPEGYYSLSNRANLGGNDKYVQKETLALGKDLSLKTSAAYDNAAIGIVELNNDYTIKKVMKPLLVFNGVEDETERPTIINHDGKWYLFTSMHGWHMAGKNVKAGDAFMLGFSANSLTGNYRPLNDGGLVLHSRTPYNSRTMTYSYDILPSKQNPFVMSSYISEIGNRSLGRATLSPGFLININGNQTNIQKQPVLQQGQLVTNN